MPSVLEMEVATSAADVALPGAETAIITSPPIAIPGENTIVSIRAWCQIQNAGAATTFTLRIRRGGVAGTLIGEGNAENIATVTDDQSMLVSEVLVGPSGGQTYTLTASNGTALTSLQAGIEVRTARQREDVIV